MSKSMKDIRTPAALLALALGLCGCGALSRTPPAGIPLADVTARLGQPSATYPTRTAARCWNTAASRWASSSTWRASAPMAA